MPKILLLVPFFMGYEKTLYKELSKRFDVILVNCDAFDNEILSEYRKCGKIHWAFRHFCKWLENKEKEAVMERYDDELMKKIDNICNCYDIVICINGGYISKRFYRIIRTKNPQALFIYYAWDDKKNLFSSSHIDLFDKVYSYNIVDCEKNKWSYVPMFVQGSFKGHKDTDLYDIAFIGTAHSDRIEIAETLVQKYSKRYRLFIYLYSQEKTGRSYFHNKPITYEEYLDILSKSNAVLDISAENQDGPTTRVFDALMTNTKVITTNKSIERYPVFSRNVFITDRDTLDIDSEFFDSEYYESTYKALTPYNWLRQIGVFTEENK